MPPKNVEATLTVSIMDINDEQPIFLGVLIVILSCIGPWLEPVLLH